MIASVKALVLVALVACGGHGQTPPGGDDAPPTDPAVCESEFQASLDRKRIPIWAIIVAIGVSGGVGIVAGLFPAWKAARLDPIEALRAD